MSDLTPLAQEFTDDGQTYWLGGVWDEDGQILWSSWPESYDSEAEAVQAASVHLGFGHVTNASQAPERD